MNLDAFTRQRAGDWDELTALVARAGRRPQKLGPAGVRRLGTTYRAAAADLALARRRWPGDPVTARLPLHRLLGARLGAAPARRPVLAVVADPGPLRRPVGGVRPGRSSPVPAQRLPRGGRA